MINFLVLFFLSFQLVPGQQSDLEWVGGWPFSYCNACATDTVRDICFLQSGGGVYILDISDPNDPVKLSNNIRTDGPLINLYYEYQNQYLFLVKRYHLDEDSATNQDHLSTQIWDIGDPDNPSFISEFYYGSFWPFNFQDSLVYLIMENNTQDYSIGYSVMNFADPYQVQEIYTHTQSEIFDLCLDDSILITSSDSIYIFNNSDPLNPTLITTLPYENIVFMETKDNYLFAINASENLLFSFDLDDPANPSIADTCFFNNPSYLDSRYINLHRNFIVTSSRNSGLLEVMDIADPDSIFSYDTNTVFAGDGYHNQFAINEQYTYLTHEDSGLITVDITDPGNPQLTHLMKSTDKIYDFALTDDYLFSINYQDYWKLEIFDITNLNNIQPISSCSLTEYSWLIEVNDPYAYIVEFLEEDTIVLLEIVDINDPYQPTVINACTLELTYISTISIKNNLLFAGYLYDISDPINPVYISSFDKNGEQMIIHDNIGYLTDYCYIYICDITDPYNPIWLSSISCGWGKFVHCINHIFLQNYGFLHMINVENPSNPWTTNFIQITHLFSGSYLDLWSIINQGHYLVITSTEAWTYPYYPSRIFIVDISDVNNPCVEKVKVLNNYAVQTKNNEDIIFILTSYTGLQIYRYPPLVSVSESPPNLSSLNLNSTFFSSSHPLLSLSGLPVGVEISIYSVDGRKVFDTNYTQPEFHLNLNNLNISSGIYFLKVSDDQGDDLLMKKIELLK
ncbi:MAG: hypothetical protein APR63_12635 [Desulfuromonas sp. SDB]|nr:MAG: hypothetical protein APR63_12635 [Desulfuromonas sp. SDB]